MSVRCCGRPGRSLCTVVVVVALVLSGCQWRGLNSMPLPGTQGGGPGSFTIQAQLPDVGNIEQNSRVRVGDVNVGTVTKIERQGWHALVTMRLGGLVDLPANATATVGQTSLLGSLHIELASPANAAPQGRLHDGSVIPLADSAAYPTTDKTLAALSFLLNGGGIGQVQEITAAFATAWQGRQQDLRSLIAQLDTFTARLGEQTDDVITAQDSLNSLVGQLAARQPVLDRALAKIPRSLAVLAQQRRQLTDAITSFGRFSSLATDIVDNTKSNLIQEVRAAGPVFEALANAGPDLTRSLSLLATFPFPKENINKFVRGDYANTDAIIDLTLSRIDAGVFTGTRWEGDLTELEMQWGRTIGVAPSPYTSGNPLVAPYHHDQGR
ncbi:virulence factor Mce family protein [Mycolicibacterium sp. A43C]